MVAMIRGIQRMGAGMTIQHIGQSIISTPSCRILLKNVLHVSQAIRNLSFVHHLTSDNDVFLKLHPSFSLIKDWLTRHPLLHGQCKNALYLIPPSLYQDVF
jgi:hypothetical protein